MAGAMGRLRPRLVVALGLILLIGAVVVFARLLGGDPAPTGLPPNESSAPTVDPTAGDDGEVLPTSTYADDASVLDRATAFIREWLRRDLPRAEWHAGLTPLVTDTLKDSLAGVDPKSVPADRATTDARLLVRTERHAVVRCEVDAGSLTLTLVLEGSSWLVDGVDWERL